MKKNRVLAGVLTFALAVGLVSVGAAEWKETTKGGKTARREWIGESGKTETGPEGYAAVTYSYSGTAVTEKYYDAEGNPAVAFGGYAGRILTYGNKHRLEDVVYLDENGEKTTCSAGYARVRINYTAAGGVTQAGYYGLDNKLVTVPSLGYALMKSEYRGTTLTRTEYQDEDKKLVDTPLGYAVMIQSVNKANKVTGIRFEHADGRPAVCLEGWASMKRELDKKNREASVKYYDLAGNLTDRGLGYAYETKTWSSDQVCVVRRYDAADRQVAMGSGYAAVQREMNRDDQVIREVYLDENGDRTKNAEGAYAKRYQYDADGRLTGVTFEDAQGAAAETASGYAGFRETLDENGFVLNRVYLDKNGNPVNTAEGWSEIRYLYDDSHQIIKTEYYDVNGALTKQE